MLPKFKLFPQMPTAQQQQQMKWSLQWCLTNPPIGTPIAPPGLYVVVVSRSKILFFVSILNTTTYFLGTEILLLSNEKRKEIF